MANQNFAKLGLPFPVPSKEEQRVDLDIKDVWFVLVYAIAGLYTALTTVNPANIPRFVIGKYRFKENGDFQLYNPDTGKYHTLAASGDEGTQTTSLGEGEI